MGKSIWNEKRKGESVRTRKGILGEIVDEAELFASTSDKEANSNSGGYFQGRRKSD